MISVNNGIIEFKGSKLTIITEVTVLIHELVVETKHFTKEDMIQAVELGCQDTEEVKKEVFERMQDPDNVLRLLSALVDTQGKEKTAEFLRKVFQDKENK